MKKILVIIMCGVMIMSMISGCGSKTGIDIETMIGANDDTKDDTKGKNQGDDIKKSPYETVTAEKQDFSTSYLKAYTTRWDDEDGLYIYTETYDSIPYVLIWRYKDASIDAKQFLEEVIYNQMTEKYGSDLIEAGPVTDYSVGGKTIPGILFTYKLNEYTIHSLRLAYMLGDDIISIMAKYVDGEGDITMRALDVAVENFTIGTKKASDNNPAPGKKADDDVVITPSENASVNYVKYTDASGYFSMDIPKGWTVTVGLPPEYTVDLISYAITVSDPVNADRKLYFNLNCVGGLKSDEARNWYNTWYPDTFGALPAIEDVSTEGFFSVMGQYYGYSDFSVRENIGRTSLNGNLLNATAKSSATGKTIRGLFTAMVDGMSNIVFKSLLDYSAGTVDVGFVSAYTIIYETAPEEEFIDWQPVIDHCFASLEFSDTFLSQRAKQWQAVMGTSTYISNTANEISDMIMDTWESRNTSYDVISQKQSDAILGYDRVLDTETGEYYRADAGFGDVFDNDRYVVVDDDAAYLTPSSGWIEWKK